MGEMGLEPNQDWQAEIASALEWWREAGVDGDVAESPRDWLSASSAPAQAKNAAAAATALHLPATLEAFATWRISDEAPEHEWDGIPIAACGPARAALMVLVEMPEREDATEARLLSGPAGRLFDRMLAAMGLIREDVLIASIATVRPVSGRIASERAETLAAMARHHVALVAPKFLLLLGNGPDRAIMGTEKAADARRLRPLNQDGATMALSTYHPAFLLERPAAKAEAWKDLQLLMKAMKS